MIEFLAGLSLGTALGVGLTSLFVAWYLRGGR